MNKIFITYCILSIANLSYSQITFETPSVLFDHPVERAEYAYPIVPIDDNGDGATDFVVDMDSGEGVILFSNDGQNNFTQTLLGGNISLVDVQDMDSDGDLDIIARNGVLIKDSNESYTYHGLFSEFGTIHDVGDVNGDGILDFVMIDFVIFGADILKIYTVNSDFESELVYELNMSDYGYSKFIDIDQDGDLDLVTVSDQMLTSCINDGSGNFTTHMGGGVNPDSDLLAFVEADCDIYPEVMYFDSNRPILADNYGALSGKLHTANTISTQNAYLLAVGDLDNDGKEDLVTVVNNSGTRNIQVLRNSGGYQFDDPITIDERASHSGSVVKNNYGNEKQKNLWVYDYDGDGLKDIIYVDGFEDQSAIYYYRNISGQDHLSCTYDDEIILTSQADVDNFTSNYGDCSTLEADVTISGNDIANLNGLGEVDFIHGCLVIDNNPMLSSLDGLSLARLNTNIIITNNAILSDISALNEVFFFELISLDKITIENNPALSECSIDLFCPEFLGFFTEGEANISGNAIGCESLQAVKDGCNAQIDMDGDGYTADIDCDDFDPSINPSAEEVCDEEDNNCDGVVDEGFELFVYYADIDMDGYGTGNPFTFCEEQSFPIFVAQDGDCAPNNPDINPGAEEIPNNGIDEDCDGEDLIIVDNDMDGYTSDIDCDDTNPEINPGAIEIPYNALDDDCNPNTVDDDIDLDGFLMADDCNDENPDINPEAEDIPNNGIDEDCDGMDALSSVNELGGVLVTVGPNPVRERLHVLMTEPKTTTITLMTLEGKSLVNTISHRGQTTLDVSHLACGQYILMITNESGARIVEKIVID